MPDALFLYFNKEHYKSKSSYLLETSTIFVKILTQSFFKDYHHEKYQKKLLELIVIFYLYWDKYVAYY